MDVLRNIDQKIINKIRNNTYVQVAIKSHIFFFHEQDENIGFHQYIIVRFYEYINNTNQRNFEKKN